MHGDMGIRVLSWSAAHMSLAGLCHPWHRVHGWHPASITGWVQEDLEALWRQARQHPSAQGLPDAFLSRQGSSYEACC